MAIVVARIEISQNHLFFFVRSDLYHSTLRSIKGLLFYITRLSSATEGTNYRNKDEIANIQGHVRR